MNPSLTDAIFEASWKYMPLSLLEFVEYIPSRVYSRVRRMKKIIDKVSGRLVDRATEEAQRVAIEKGKKDVMSVLGN